MATLQTKTINMEFLNPINDIRPAIIARMQDEYKAHLFYRNASNWCDITGFSKAAAYFAGEAESELQHALKLQKYLNDWNISYSMPTASIQVSFRNLPDLLRSAYELEANLYKAYQIDATGAMAQDISAFNLLSEMVQIQYESVAEYRTLLDKLELTSDMLIYEDAAFG